MPGIRSPAEKQDAIRNFAKKISPNRRARVVLDRPETANPQNFTPMAPVEKFVHAIRRRMSWQRALRAFLWSVLAAAVVLLGVSLLYMLQGYAVPRFWYAVAAGGALAGGLVAAILRRPNLEEAAACADNAFHLRDSIVSQRRFESEHREGGFFDLQAERTAGTVAKLDPAALPFPWPRRLATGAGLLALAASLTAFKSTDQSVLDRLAREEMTEDRMEELRKDFEEAIRELEKSADEEELKELNANELKKYVDELKATKDLAEAMKQLAELERKMDKAAKALEQKKEAQLMKKAGEELEKEEDPQARELAKKLKNEQFKEAAKDLAKMMPQDDEAKKTPEKRKEAAKLKAAAKRMASAARAQKSNQAKNSQNGRENQQNGQQAQVSQAPQEQELSEELEQLEMEADEYDQQMEEMEAAEKAGKVDPSKLGKLEASKAKLGERLGKLGQRLGKMGAKRAAKMKLLGMCKNAGQGQGFLQGMGQSPFAMPGGKEAGVGSVDSRREGSEELSDNGNTSQLKGQKGSGPSLTKVEAADDGTGVSSRRGEARERTFRRQFESFVQREDVPEDLKAGVRNYFNALHAAEEASGAPPAK